MVVTIGAGDVSENEWLITIGIAAGFCAGALSGWAVLLMMTSEQREGFLRGVADGVNPMFWWRKVFR